MYAEGFSPAVLRFADSIFGRILLFALVFAVVPLLALFAQSLQGQDCDCIGLENFETFFGSRYFRRALFNSLNVATAATILSLAIGVPLAILFTRFRFPGRPVLMTMIVMCMLSPPFIGAYAWVILFGRGGMVTLRDAGMTNIFAGLTTADEVIRETILEA